MSLTTMLLIKYEQLNNEHTCFVVSHNFVAHSLLCVFVNWDKQDMVL